MPAMQHPENSYHILALSSNNLFAYYYYYYYFLLNGPDCYQNKTGVICFMPNIIQSKIHWRLLQLNFYSMILKWGGKISSKNKKQHEKTNCNEILTFTRLKCWQNIKQKCLRKTNNKKKNKWIQNDHYQCQGTIREVNRLF